jgi:hypothetical protein
LRLPRNDEPEEDNAMITSLVRRKRQNAEVGQ